MKITRVLVIKNGRWSMIKELLKRYRKWIFCYLLLGIFASFLSCLNIMVFQKIIDSSQTIPLFDNVIRYIIIYGIILVSVCTMEYLQNYPENYLQNAITERIKIMSLEKISRIDYRDYQEIGTGKIVQLIENGALAGTDIIFSFFLKIFSDLLPSVVFSMFFIGSINVKIMLVLVLGYIFVFLISQLLMKKLYNYKEKLLDKQEEKAGYSIRSFMELVVFRVNKQYRNEIKKIEETAKDVVGTGCKIVMIHEAFFTIFEMIVIIIKISLLFFGIKNIISGKTTIGVLVALVSFVERIYSPIAIFNVLYVQYKLNKFSFKRLVDFISKKDDKNLYCGQKIEKAIGKIDIRNLSYSYNKRTGFSGLNIVIEKGKKIALVGESGSGKSTLIKLICGLLKKQGGSILIDGIDIDDIELDSYYDHLAYLSQETSVFDGTVRENIVFQNKIDDEKIYEYLKEVNLYEKVKSLENGLDTRIGEHGTQFSGGERQRLALARVMANKKDIVLLDEATSALDTINEQMVINNVINNL